MEAHRILYVFPTMVVEYDCDHCVREAHVVEAQPQCQATEGQNIRLIIEAQPQLFYVFPTMVVEYDVVVVVVVVVGSSCSQ